MANIKARELDDLYKKHGDKATVMIMTHLIERQNDLEAGLTVLGQMVDKITDIVSSFATVAGNMKDTIEAMQPKEENN